MPPEIPISTVLFPLWPSAVAMPTYRTQTYFSSTVACCPLPLWHLVSLSKELAALRSVGLQTAALPACLICNSVWTPTPLWLEP